MQPVKKLIDELKKPGQDIAFVIHLGNLYYTVYPVTTNEPYSASVILMQKLSDDQTFKLRSEDKYVIYTSETDYAMMEGMAHLLGMAADGLGNIHKLEYQEAFEIKAAGWADRTALDKFKHPESPLFTRVPQEGGSEITVNLDLTAQELNGHSMKPVHRLYMMAAYSLAVSRSEVCSGTSGAPIGCVLADRNGKILGWGINTNGVNKTLHAEVNMIQAYYKRNKGSWSGLPANCAIYTTLKPCKMCAAMIERVGLANKTLSLKVYEGQNDPGFNASNTALDDKTHSAVQVVLGKDATGINAIKIPEATQPQKPGVVADKSAQAQATEKKTRELNRALENKYRSEQTKKDKYNEGKYPITSFLKDQEADPKDAKEKVAILPQAHEAFLSKVEQYSTGGAKMGDPFADKYKGNPNVWVALRQITDYLAQIGVPGVKTLQLPSKTALKKMAAKEAQATQATNVVTTTVNKTT